MADGPWEMLGLAPTGDELAIRRAYAKRLKDFRPDEDPAGFQKLVAARERALAWRFPAPGGHDEEDEWQGDEDGEDDEAVEEAEEGAHEAAPPHAIPAFDSRALARAAAADPEDGRQAQALRAVTVKLNALHALGAANGDWGFDSPAWDGAAWREIQRALAALTLEQRRRLRPDIVRNVLPRLPKPVPRRGLAESLASGDGPVVAVDVLEGEFALSEDQTALSGLVGGPAALAYVDWAEALQRAQPMERRSEAERNFLAQLAALTPTAADPAAWTAAAWRALILALRRLDAAETRRGRESLARALVRALPIEAKPDSAAFAEGRGAAASVEAVEAELRFAATPGMLDQLCGDAPVKPYLDWLAIASGERALAARRALGEGAYRDVNGIALLPSEDSAESIWGDKRFAAAWAEARKRGAWPRSFDWRAFLLPATSLGFAGRWLAGLGVLASEWAVDSALIGQGKAQASFAVGLALVVGALIVRAVLAAAIARVAVAGAMRKVRRLDRAGIIGAERRLARLAVGRGVGAFVRFCNVMERLLLIGFVVGAIGVLFYAPSAKRLTAADFVVGGIPYANSDPVRATDPGETSRLPPTNHRVSARRAGKSIQWKAA